jgi:hypothetical protein
MKGRPTLWLVAALVLVFLAGLAGGIFLDRSVIRHRSPLPRRPGSPFPSLDMMARELGLSAEQQARIKDIFERNEERFKKLRGDIHQRLDEIRTNLENEINSVLTPGQIEKFKKMIEKHRAYIKKEEGRHRPPREDSPPSDQKEGEKQ